MPRSEAQIRRAPDRATFDVTGDSSRPRKIASTRPTLSLGRRQNSDSPSIIMLESNPNESNVFMTLLNRDDISPTQIENFRDRVIKLVCELACRNLSTRALPHALMDSLRLRFESTSLVEIGPNPADTILKEVGRLSFRTFPIPGAPASVLTVSPPEKTDATVPNPVLHSISQR
jgi:hypothetical protein